MHIFLNVKYVSQFINTYWESRLLIVGLIREDGQAKHDLTRNVIYHKVFHIIVIDVCVT